MELCKLTRKLSIVQALYEVGMIRDTHRVVKDNTVNSQRWVFLLGCMVLWTIYAGLCCVAYVYVCA